MDTTETIQKLARSTFTSSDFEISKVNEGVSTNVYKIIKANDSFYLRMSHESDEMMSPQVVAHDLLIKAGVKVPEIVAWSDETDEVGFPYMIVRETPGISLERLRDINRSAFDACIDEVLFNAGEDIARTSGITLEKFGWIDRETKDTNRLIANVETYPEFLLHRFESTVNYLKDLGFGTYKDNEIEKYKALVNQYLNIDISNLAQGDFSLPHIYVENGKYSGIIDWGDIRSTGKLYDLAHFSAYESSLLKSILKGFNNLLPVQKNDDVQLVLTRISISVRKLGWIAKHIPQNFENHPFKDVILWDREYLNNL